MGQRAGDHGDSVDDQEGEQIGHTRHRQQKDVESAARQRQIERADGDLLEGLLAVRDGEAITQQLETAPPHGGKQRVGQHTAQQQRASPFFQALWHPFADGFGQTRRDDQPDAGDENDAQPEGPATQQDDHGDIGRLHAGAGVDAIAHGTAGDDGDPQRVAHGEAGEAGGGQGGPADLGIAEVAGGEPIIADQHDIGEESGNRGKGDQMRWRGFNFRHHVGQRDLAGNLLQAPGGQRQHEQPQRGTSPAFPVGAGTLILCRCRACFHLLYQHVQTPLPSNRW